MTSSLPLSRVIARHTATAGSPALEALSAELGKLYGSALGAILFYGSCLRSGDHYEGLVDLYCLVDDYTAAYGRGPAALFNWLLPPNVYYQETVHEGQTVRAKYAVVSIADFQRGTSNHWFHSYLWGRFTQPSGIAYVRDRVTAELIHDCLAQAAITFAGRVLPRLPPSFTAMELWQQGLQLSYRAELRAEQADARTRELVESAADYYRQIMPGVMAAMPYPVVVDSTANPTAYRAEIDDRTRALNRLGWYLRRTQGKALSVMRLLKAFFTFQGGLDYIIWKLERHSGTRIEVPERTRRYPLIFVWGLFWRLYRRGLFR